MKHILSSVPYDHYIHFLEHEAEGKKKPKKISSSGETTPTTSPVKQNLSKSDSSIFPKVSPNKNSSPNNKSPKPVKTAVCLFTSSHSRAKASEYHQMSVINSDNQNRRQLIGNPILWPNGTYPMLLCSNQP